MGQCCGKSKSSNQVSKPKKNISTPTMDSLGNSQLMDFNRDKDFFINQDNWMLKNNDGQEALLDPDKFLFFYQNYQAKQEYYKQIWDDIQFADQAVEEQQDFRNRSYKNCILREYKYIIRKGIPLRQTRDIILKMFKMDFKQLQEQYETMQKVIFQDRSKTTIIRIPSFSTADDITKILKICCLTHMGVRKLKKIMWNLHESLPNLEFNPLIIQTVNFLLMFLTEWETFFVLKAMVEESYEYFKNENTDYMKMMRWHFTMTEKDFHKSAQLFIDLATQRCDEFRQILEHFQKINYSQSQFKNQFKDWCSYCFAGFFQFSTIIRITIMFFNEGFRIFYKIVYSICILLKDQLLKTSNPEEVDQIFYLSFLDRSQEGLESLIGKAFTLNIKKVPITLSRIKSASSIIYKPKQVYYRPRLPIQSEIIKYSKFEEIWGHLPNIRKLTNPIQIFSTSKNGYLLSNLFKSCEQYLLNPMLIVIKTKNLVFGGFNDKMFGNNYKDNKCISEEQFIYFIEPAQVFFPANHYNQGSLTWSSSFISFELEDVSFTLDVNLNGFLKISENCQKRVFNGKPITDSTFKTLTLEVYALQF